MRKFLIFLIVSLFYSNLYTQQLVVKLNEGFELTTFPPLGWKRISPLGAKVWERKTIPLPPEIMQPPIQGNAVARIDMENTGGEDWLITKKISNIEIGDSLLFYLIKQYSGGPYPPDSMNIRVSITDSLMPSFSNFILRINVAGLPVGNQVWHRYSLSLTQFAGQNIYIAFQHKNTNGHGCAIDSIVVFNPSSIGIKKFGNQIPNTNVLYQNYPNPFNPQTKIRYQIVKSGYVKLKVYNILGKEIATLVNGELQAGIYEVQFPVNNLSNFRFTSGVYYYRIETENFSDIKSMILLK